MKFLSRVVWSEGMYLAPHHFQTQSRHVEDSLTFLANSLWNEPWGFLRLDLDARAIANGTISLLQAAGLFPDGLAFDIPTSDSAPPSRNIAADFSPSGSELLLFLAIAERKNVGYDIGSANSDVDARYRPVAHILRDETNGTDEQEVELAHKNLRILLASELTSGLLSIPIARVVRDSRGVLTYDPDFVPPSLRISASDSLMLLLTRLLETIAEKSSTVLRGSQRADRFEPGVSPLEIANFWFLHALHSALPPLRHLLLTRRAHPADCFLELSRFAAALCTFAVDSDPSALPDYDHHDPGPAFFALNVHILRHLEIIVPTNVIPFQFTSSAPYIHKAAIPDQRVLRHARWALGVRSSIGESDLLRLVPRLVKLCSARFVPELVKRALPGMTLTHLPVPPSALRPEPDMQYFAVDLADACWEHILQTATVGIYIPGEIADSSFTLSAILGTSLS